MFQVLHSSAGAGKTHALVKHYLTLALKDPDQAAYSRILALTFTNKAAAEMRERIISYLEGLAEGSELDGALADVRDTIIIASAAEAMEIQHRAQRTLTHILHHWPRMAVCTIDAFTRRVVMPFARDLELDSELRMTTEEDYYRNEAVDLLLEEAGIDHALTDLLVATCEQLLEEERDWRADKPLRDLAKQLTKEQALEHLEKLREFGNERFIALQRTLRERTNGFREKLRAMGRTALDTIEAAGLSESDLAHGKGGPFGYLKQLAAFDTWLDEKKNTLKVLESDKWESAKAQGATLDAVHSIAPLLRDTINAVETLRASGELKKHALTVAVLRDLMPAATLHLLDDRLERIKHDEGIAFFSDLVKKVARIVQEEPAPFLYERLGEKYKHYLIDEFQDTSLLQWHALLPLLENALSTDGSALLVGDAKQAIYRWRNGEVRQFIDLPDLFGKEKLMFGEDREAVLKRSFVQSAPLAENFRSARSIIGFNNTFFAALKSDGSDDLRKVYEEHEQRAVKEAQGFVSIRCYAEEEPDEDVAPEARLVADAITEAMIDGFRAGDIAVLVRTANQGRTIAEHLMEQGLKVVSPDGLSLGGDPGVRAMMGLFAWLCRPDDVSASLAVQYITLLRSHVGTVDPFASEKPVIILRKWCAEHPRVRARLPLFALLCAIAEALALDPALDAFTLGLLNEAHEFSTGHGDDRNAFLEHWERVANKRSVGGADSPDAVRVMTIHKAKGLQFPVVIVPYTSMGTGGGKGEMIWIDPRDAVEELPSALVRMKKELEALGVPEVTKELEMRALDELDLLYVAFTRPEQRLYAGVASKGNERWAKAMREFLHLGPGDAWTSGAREPAVIKKERAQHSFSLAASFPRERVAIAIRQDAPEQWEVNDPDPFRSHGRALHAVLARVRVPADLDAAINAEADAWGLNAEEIRVMRGQLAALLQQPALAPFFGEGLHVRTEATVIDATGHAHRPDRIVNDGARTRVLDIKTGSPAEHHQQQVRDYAKLLRELGERDVSAHLLYVRDAQVVDVE